MSIKPIQNDFLCKEVNCVPMVWVLIFTLMSCGTVRCRTDHEDRIMKLEQPRIISSVD